MATKDTPVTDEKSTTVETKTTKHHLHHSPLWWVLGTLVTVCVLMMIAGAMRHFWQQRALTNSNFGPGMGRMIDRFDRDGRGGAFGGGMMGGTTNNSTMVSGVVTAIDGATLTVAGNGTTKAVTTNDTTEYFGAAQPVKVNDSVRITGTTSGDAFTATRVMIQRQ